MEIKISSKTKKILSIVANVLVWAFLVLSVLTTVLVFTAQGSEDGVPAVFGKSLISVTTDSMEGTFDRGDLILLEKLPTGDSKRNLPIGTIITYHAPVDLDGDGQLGDINTHRIVGIEGNSYITQGDNKKTNPIPDNQGDKPYVVYFTDVIGVVDEDDAIGGLGGVIAFLHSSLGFFICIVLPLALFFLYELYRFISLVISERSARVPAVSAETEEEIKRRAIEEYLRAQQEAAAANAAPAGETPETPAGEEAGDAADEGGEETTNT